MMNLPRRAASYSIGVESRSCQALLSDSFSISSSFSSSYRIHPHSRPHTGLIHILVLMPSTITIDCPLPSHWPAPSRLVPQGYQIHRSSRDRVLGACTHHYTLPSVRYILYISRLSLALFLFYRPFPTAVRLASQLLSCKGDVLMSQAERSFMRYIHSRHFVFPQYL